jgi:copper resistance protein C
MNKQLLRGVAVTVLAGLALLLGAAPAMAHARLISSDPVDGASLDAGPQRVSLTFSDPMTGDFDTINVVGPDGNQYQTGEVGADGSTVSIAVAPLGPTGRYEIGYRVVSADGHPVTGSVAFTLTTPGPASAAPAQPPAAADPAAAADSEESGAAPFWPWIVGALVLVGAGVAVALRLGKTLTR